MLILACADLHGRPERIARVRSLVEQHASTVLLLPGDLTHAGGGIEALDLLVGLPVKATFAVPGNMDLTGAIDVTAQMRERGALLEGDLRYVDGVSFGGPDARSPCDVLVVHEPPYGTLDFTRHGEHIGSQAVLDQLRRLRPRVLTCGHVHESPGIERVQETLVVNCTMGTEKASGALIDLSGSAVKARLLSPS